MEAAFFDLDKTVIAKASLLAFGRTFFKEGLISRRDVFRSIYGQAVYRYLGANEKRLSKIQRVASSVTLGWDQQMVMGIVESALHGIVAPLVFEEAVELIHEHRNAGRKVYLVSATPAEIVGPIALFLGVDGYISSIPSTDDDGKYTGTMEFYAFGKYKVDAMELLAKTDGIDLAGSYAYSDSYTDIPMLGAVGHPVAVNPDRILEKHANDEGWEIAHFVRRTPLPHEGSSKKQVTIATATAAVAIVGAAATAETFRRLRRRS